MDAEIIVRALAQASAPIDSEYDVCKLCGSEFDHYKPSDDGHEAACPWRMACEWVAANGC